MVEVAELKNILKEAVESGKKQDAIICEQEATLEETQQQCIRLKEVHEVERRELLAHQNSRFNSLQSDFEESQAQLMGEQEVTKEHKSQVVRVKKDLAKALQKIELYRGMNEEFGLVGFDDERFDQNEGRNNKDSNTQLLLEESQNKIDHLYRTIEEKSDKLQKLENLKNDNKRLSRKLEERNSIISSSEEKETLKQLTANIASLNSRKLKDEVAISNLEDEVSILHIKRDDAVLDKERLARDMQALSKAKLAIEIEHSLLAKNVEDLTSSIDEYKKKCEESQTMAEETKKLMVSSQRYWDCERVTAKKEAEDTRQQLSRLRDDKLLHTTRVESLEKELLNSTHELQQLHALSVSSDAQLIDKLKEDLKKCKDSNGILQKEAIAVREARTVEVLDLSNLRSQVSVLHQASESKDQEIKLLQKEVKNALSSSIKQMAPITPATPVKLEQSPEECLKEQLAARDAEISKLLQQLSVSRDDPQSPPVEAQGSLRRSGRSTRAAHVSTVSAALSTFPHHVRGPRCLLKLCMPFGLLITT